MNPYLYGAIGLALFLIALFVVRQAKSQTKAKSLLDVLYPFFPSYAQEDLSDELFKELLNKKLAHIHDVVHKNWRGALVEGELVTEEVPEVQGDEEMVTRSVIIQIHSDPVCKDLLSFLADNPKGWWTEAPQPVAVAFAGGRRSGFLYTANLNGYGTIWIEIPRNTSGVDAVRIEVHPLHNASIEWYTRFREIARVSAYENFTLDGIGA